MKHQQRRLPRLTTETQEARFWANADSTDYVDWATAERLTLPNLKPSVRTISLRLPETLLAELKTLANKRDVPYQSLLKVLLAQAVAAEQRKLRKAA